ncbi:RHS repeat-associated core domain-containing protein [Streptomyces sp. NPDC005492]|uniref:RHS repeat-associated core domain-containing protein n=1 Tax=Streptomyces sp. NPDC005492 TaxID=3156883 RepID=UPI0033B8D67E
MLVVSGALVAGLVSGVPATAAPQSATSHVTRTPSVPAQSAAATRKDEVDPTPTKPAKASWPEATGAVVNLKGVKRGTALAVAPSGAVVDAAGTSADAKAAAVSVGPAPYDLVNNAPHSSLLNGTGAANAASVPASVHVEVLDRKAVAPAGAVGLGVQLTRKDGVSAAGPVLMTLDYSGFKNAYGGDFASRVRLVKFPACALTTPKVKGCSPGDRTIVRATNDTKNGTLTATVEADGDPSGTLSGQLPSDGLDSEGLISGTSTQLERSAPLAASTSSSATVYAVASGSSSDAGDYRASSLSPSGSWNVSAGSGAFTYNLPIELPKPPTGSAPSLSLSYNSQSVDGLTSAANTQASWAGLGWDLNVGYIERRYRNCSQDGVSGVGDLCWDSPNTAKEPDGAVYVISLNGVNSELVQDDTGTGSYHVQDDPGWRVQHLTGGHGADDEYWVISEQNGTRYYFGWGRSERTDPDANWDKYTHSVLTVPVVGNNAGEPCYSQFPEPCTQAYRWNLDRVVDANEVETSYFYEKQENHYRSVISTDKARVYDAASYLTRIEYGWASQISGAQLPAEVTLGHVGRCVERMSYTDPLTQSVPACPGISDHPDSYPDVPTDLMCDGTAADDSCKSITGVTYSPTFFSTDMLWDIHTWVRDSDTSAWDPAMQYQMKYGLPDPSGTIGNQLWLDYVERKGYGDGPDITLPTINFNGEWKDNQVGSSLLNFRRVNEVHGDLGSFVDVTYAQPDACDIDNLPTESSNTQDCFKQMWTPEGATSQRSGWFKKYLVSKVTSDAGVGKGADDDGDPVMTTTYEYHGGAAWAFPNDPLTPDSDESWSDWRGYQQVEVFTGTKANAASTYYWLYQGMDGDRTSKTDSSQTRSASVTDGAGTSYTDHAWLSGQVLESSQRDGTGQSHQRVWHGYWWYDTATYDGLPDARFVREAATTTDELISGGAWREHVVTNVYDNSSSVSTTYGLPVRTEDAGDSGVTGDERCTVYGRAYDTDTFTDSSVKRWMVLRDETIHHASTCANRTDANRDSDTVTLYDGATSLATDKPTDGNPTTSTVYTDATHSRTVTSTYDTAGRIRTSTDGKGNATGDTANHTTTTTYSSATSWPTSGVKVTTPDPDGSGSGTAMSTTTWYSRLWGSAYKILDANGRTTRIDHDSVGRTSAVWKPTEVSGYDAGTTPSMRFTYTITTASNSDGVPYLVNRGDAPPVVKSETLQSGTTYVSSYTYLDGLGRTRETQTTAPGGTGRTVTSTRYDTSGNVTGTSAPFYNTSSAGSAMVNPTVASLPSYTDLLVDFAGRTTQSRILVYEKPQIQDQTITNYHGDYTTTVPSVGERTNTYTDVFGEPTKVVEFGGSTYTTSYLYTATGKLSKITDAKGNISTYTYDWAGERLTTTDPDTGHSSTTYDDNGNVFTTTDATSATATDPATAKVTYAYDNLNRPLSVSQGSTVLAAHTYDTAAGGLGQLASATTYSGGKAYTTSVTGYDADGRATGTKYTLPDDGMGMAGSYTYSYGYDAAGHQTSVSYPAVGGLPAETVTTAYDGLGLPTKVTGSLGTTYVDATNFDTLGRLTGRTYGTTATTTTTAQRSYAYDDSTGTGWLSNITTTTSTKGTVQNDSYTRDASGQTTGLKDNLTGQSECYTYDELDRVTRAWTTEAATGCSGAFTPDLTSTALSPYQLDYTYDGIGNLQKVTSTTSSGAAVRDYVYPGYSADQSTYTAGAAQPHGVTSIATSSGTNAYSYDAAGRMKSRTESGISTDYAWNTLGQLTKTTVHATGGDKTTSYVYDPDGNLLERVAPTESVLYLGAQEIHKAGTASPVATRYYSDGTSTSAMRVAGTGNGTLTWVMSDLQNSSQVTIDTATGTAGRRRYLPFGAQRSTSLPSSTDRGFLGKTEDDSTGLDILGARAYDPTLGRFLSADPMSSPYAPQGLNAYTYSRNNPTNFSDPTGLDPGGTQGTCLYDPSLPCKKSKPATAAGAGAAAAATLGKPNKGDGGSRTLTLKDGSTYRLNNREINGNADEKPVFDYLNNGLKDQGKYSDFGDQDGIQYVGILREKGRRTADMIRLKWSGGKIVEAIRVDIVTRASNAVNGAIMRLKDKAGQMAGKDRQADAAVVSFKGVSEDDASAILSAAKDQIDMDAVKAVSLDQGNFFDETQVIKPGASSVFDDIDAVVGVGGGAPIVEDGVPLNPRGSTGSSGSTPIEPEEEPLPFEPIEPIEPIA